MTPLKLKGYDYLLSAVIVLMGQLEFEHETNSLPTVNSHHHLENVKQKQEPCHFLLELTTS